MVRARRPRLILVGDVAAETADPREMMRHVTPYAEESAIAFCNCEWPLTDRGSPWPGKAGRVVRSSPDKIGMYAGFDVVSLANNHIMNYGADGLIQTMSVLDAAGIVYCGAGCNLDEAHRPAFVEGAGTRVAFLSYTSVFTPGFEATHERPGMAVVRIETRYRASTRLHEMPGSPMEIETCAHPRDTDRLFEDVRRAREQADYVVVSWHWGVSMGYRYLVPYQVDLGRAVLDCGADLVIGHHPHALQGIEIHNGKIIAYSVAHCGFDMEHGSFADDAILLEVPLHAAGPGPVRVLPIGNAVRQPVILGAETGRPCLDRLAELSRPLGTEFTADKDAVIPVRGAKPFDPTAAFGMFR
jgi:poly-gamma-glutamate synthesis protein (capsule biosynthesis protein)